MTFSSRTSDRKSQDPDRRVFSNRSRVSESVRKETISLAAAVAAQTQSESAEIARGLKRQDQELLDRLIELYQHRLLRYLLFLTGKREVAEDLFQETWMRVLLRGAQFNGKSRFDTWLFTIARNRARSYLTSRTTHIKAAEEANREAQLLEDHVPAASYVLEKEAELRAVREVIDGLREGPEKETVRLFYLEGTLSAREIALRMGVGKSAVTMRLERFRAKIKAQLSERLAG